MARFFAIPFGTSAAKTTIPDTDSASVSWSNGYTVLYEYDPTVSGNNAKHVERDVFNTLFYDITSSIQALQIYGVAPYYDAVVGATGPGYNEGSIIFYANKTWRSKISGNKIRPNSTTTANWEEVLGYDTLVTKLKDAGLVGTGGGGSTAGYTKEEIDSLINGVTNSMMEYHHKDPGEISLLSWCGEDRNKEGFFLCNGDELPYTDAAPTSMEEFYGNALYELCFDNDGSETEFSKRWSIVIDKVNKKIQLPNILGLRKDGELTSDISPILLSVSKEAEAPDVTTIARGFVSSGNEDAFLFKMLPCVYLGQYNEDSESGYHL